MNIPVTQLLAKMNDHLQLATNQNEDTLREHITAILTLCELILENHQLDFKATPSIATNIQVIQPTERKLDEDANGDSIFDF